MIYGFSSHASQTQQNVDWQRHCVLVAASNPYPLPTPVHRLQLQKPEQNENIETQTDNQLSDAETIAKCFAQGAVSLSVFCPKQLPKLKAIYNAGKCNPRAADPPVDNAKNPHFLILISENFMEARACCIKPLRNAKFGFNPESCENGCYFHSSCFWINSVFLCQQGEDEWLHELCLLFCSDIFRVPVWEVGRELCNGTSHGKLQKRRTKKTQRPQSLVF